MQTSYQEPSCVAQPNATPDRSEHRLIVQALINRGRSAPVRSRAAWVLCPITAVMLWASFPPLDWGWVAWFALVPMLCLTRSPRPMQGNFLGAWLGGFIFWLASLQWMRLGDASMYRAWGAMAVYTSLYFPAFLLATRATVHRLSVPLVVAAPIVWVGLEFVRAHLFTGFAWYLLGHSQLHSWPAITQISDLVGGYGVSFLVMAVNAGLASLIPLEWLTKYRAVPAQLSETEVTRATVTPRRRTFAVAFAVGLVALSWGYGLIRSRTEFTAGPRVGLLQGNFPSSVQPEPGFEDDIFRTYRNLNGLAVQQQAELIVWPESMMPYVMLDAPESFTDKQLAALHPVIPVERWKDRSVQNVLTNMAEESRASLIVGAGTFIGTEGQAHSKRYNSAVFIQPTGIQGRYDKIHRVPFGEYIPLKDELPFLQSFTPYAEGFGIDAGQTVGVFRHKNFRLLPLICFEDTVPHLVRSAVEVSRSTDEKSPGDVDCLVNLSNDGWFHGSSEHDQHLITASFRCIETRVPMIRAANTGVSAIIDGNGQIRDPEVLIDFDLMKARKPYERTTLIDPATGQLPKLVNMVQVGHVPLDPRESLYVKWGDWFAISCLCFTLFAVLYGAFTGRIPIPTEPAPALG